MLSETWINISEAVKKEEKYEVISNIGSGKYAHAISFQIHTKLIYWDFE
jgi:hypothetical protein